MLEEAAALAVATSPGVMNEKHENNLGEGMEDEWLRNDYLTSFLEFLPSGWANLCIAVGAIIIGAETLYPRTVVDISILLTSTRTLGLKLRSIQEKWHK